MRLVTPIITCRGLHHRYETGNEGKVDALDGVDLDIGKGEFVAIIGPNGSGKSTLAKHFNALLQPTSGRVLVAGHDTKDPDLLWEIRKTAGMVFQNPDNQIVATVVEEDVAFGPENLGLRPEKIRERVAQALAAVDMTRYAQHAPHQLSGGQKQRVAIAGILAMQPDVLVLDEPTAMLDPSGRREVLATVKRLNKERGITVVLITHFMDEAVEADRVVVMARGKILLSGTPKEVFSQAETLRNAGLDVPQVTLVAQSLVAMGFDVPADAMSVDELVAALCR